MSDDGDIQPEADEPLAFEARLLLLEMEEHSQRFERERRRHRWIFAGALMPMVLYSLSTVLESFEALKTVFFSLWILALIAWGATIPNPSRHRRAEFANESPIWSKALTGNVFWQFLVLALGPFVTRVILSGLRAW